MGHYLHTLPTLHGSYVLVSEYDHVDQAVILVHGYGGDAWATWAKLQDLIDESESEDRWGGCDIYSFQYRGGTKDIELSTAELLKFLQLILPTPAGAEFEIPTLPDDPVLGSLAQDGNSVFPSERIYADVVLAGHSEGGVVLRNAVARLAKSPHVSSAIPRPPRIAGGVGGRIVETEPSTYVSLALHSRLRLFAPALLGFSPSGLLGIVMHTPVLGDFLDTIMHWSAAYQSLQMDDSFLLDLRRRTEELWRATSYPALRAKSLWGDREHFLRVGQYDHDDPIELADGETHKSVCKAREGYVTPMEFIQS
jgi:hypothetical protein